MSAREPAEMAQVVFVSTSYEYLLLRDASGEAAAADKEPAERG